MNSLVTALPGLVSIFVLAGGVNASAGVLFVYEVYLQNATNLIIMRNLCKLIQNIPDNKLIIFDNLDSEG